MISLRNFTDRDKKNNHVHSTWMFILTVDFLAGLKIIYGLNCLKNIN